MYLSYSNYNNTKVVKTECLITAFDIYKSRCGKTGCYVGSLILNVTSINEYPVNYTVTHSSDYDTTKTNLETNFAIGKTITCYYQVSNPSIIELNHEHKPEQDALIAGLVFVSLAGLVLIFEIAIEIYWSRITQPI